MADAITTQLIHKLDTTRATSGKPSHQEFQLMLGNLIDEKLGGKGASIKLQKLANAQITPQPAGESSYATQVRDLALHVKVEFDRRMVRQKIRKLAAPKIRNIAEFQASLTRENKELLFGSLLKIVDDLIRTVQNWSTNQGSGTAQKKTDINELTKNVLFELDLMLAFQNRPVQPMPSSAVAMDPVNELFMTTQKPTDQGSGNAVNDFIILTEPMPPLDGATEKVIDSMINEIGIQEECLEQLAHGNINWSNEDSNRIVAESDTTSTTLVPMPAPAKTPTLLSHTTPVNTPRTPVLPASAPANSAAIIRRTPTLVAAPTVIPVPIASAQLDLKTKAELLEIIEQLKQQVQHTQKNLKNM